MTDTRGLALPAVWAPMSALHWDTVTSRIAWGGGGYTFSLELARNKLSPAHTYEAYYREYGIVQFRSVTMLPMLSVLPSVFGCYRVLSMLPTLTHTGLHTYVTNVTQCYRCYPVLPILYAVCTHRTVYVCMIPSLVRCCRVLLKLGITLVTYVRRPVCVDHIQSG